MKTTLRIGTRGSQLALWQAHWVKDQLEKAYPHLQVDLQVIKTKGDKILDVPLAMVGGKGLFVKEIEDAMLAGEVDIAVHSMKDVPTYFPQGLGLPVILNRADPRDALILRAGMTDFKDLPHGARIGTSSLRRKAQLLNKRPDLQMIDIRGNVQTRLAKMDSEDLAGVVLAAAGMQRLGFSEQISQYLDPHVCLPAIGQGALGLETRQDDHQTNALIERFHDAEALATVTAERALLKRLQGGCQVPIAGYGTLNGSTLNLTGLVASCDGQMLLKQAIEGPVTEAEALGTSLADALLAAGAGAILNEVYQQETFHTTKEDV